jgi:hypothetical protein
LAAFSWHTWIVDGTTMLGSATDLPAARRASRQRRFIASVASMIASEEPTVAVAVESSAYSSEASCRVALA